MGYKSNTKVDADTKLQDWICVEGSYAEDKISCKLPNIPNFDNEDPFYVVDVSLNGQEFTNHPQTMRFYFITETNISPNEGNEEEEPEVMISGRGLFDTPFKQLTLELAFVFEGNDYSCHKVVEATWLKT